MDHRDDFLAGGGEMGERIRATDWSRTPLGPVESWPQSLRSAVSHVLPSKAQIGLCWGPDLIMLYNDAYRPVLGGKHPGALGKPLREVWVELWRMGLDEIFEGVLRTGEAFWARDRPFFLERHGYAEETTFDVSYDPVRDESGRVGGVFCIVSETTGRVVGERRLRVLRDLAGIAQQVRNVDEVFATAAVVLSRDAEDLPFALLYGAGAQGGPAKLLGGCGLEAGSPGAPRDMPLDGGALWPLGLELEIIAPSRRLTSLRAGPWPEPIEEVAIVPCASAGDAPSAWVVAGISPRRRSDEAYRDFLRVVGSSVAAAAAAVRRSEDERRRAEVLAELDRAKTAFFSNVSHEFRTPLTLISGPIEDALRDTAAPLPPGQRERFEVARRNALRLQKLVNTLLDFARIEAGRVQASYVPVELGALTADLASNFRSSAERAGLALVVDCPPLQQPVHVDREMWEKIVLNLVSNAIKFTFAGTITVRVGARDGQAVLEVADTGTGIAAKDLPHIFDRFYRVEGALSRTHEGTGIGLALVQELVKMHGGGVTVDSAEGRGTTFRVTVPFGTAHLPSERLGTPSTLPSTWTGGAAFVEEALGWLAEDTPAATVPAAVSPGPRARIVWADDNRDMREYVRRLLVDRYDVEAVPNGEAALAAARRARPDLVLTDVMMPGIGGQGLVRALRADPALRDLPIVLLSARAGEEARIEALADGADDYLVKPFSARELLARIDSRLQIARLQTEALAAARGRAEDLRDADRRKDEFLAMLSHELRNPLVPLRNGLELLRRRPEQAVDQARVVDMMARQLGQLVRLVDDLLQMSRINRGTLELRPERVTLASVVGSAIETSEPVVAEGVHHLEISLPDAPVWLNADPVRLAQLLSNLLTNAARYTPSGGRISLAAEPRRASVAVSITDTGVGFEPEAAEELFEMFRRGPQSRGLGLGLAIARRLAVMHGGTLEAASDGPGRGARFTLVLPTAAAPQPEVAPAAASARLGRDRVLVIDDDHDVADSVGMLLEAMGAEVRVAYDGAQGLSVFSDFDPKFVLLDLGMPGMDGYAVAEAIRRRFPERRPLLIALTGFGHDAEIRRAHQAGFDRHLVKPADIEAMQAILTGGSAPAPGP